MKIVHSPKRQKKKMYIFSGIVFFIVLVLFVLASIPIINPGIWEFLALIVFVYSTLMLSKFYLSEYTYILTDDEFVIYKKTGSKNVKVCHLDLFSVKAIYTDKEWKKEKNNRQITSVYNYNASIRPDKFSTIVFDMGTCFEAVLFEPSEEMKEAFLTFIHGQRENQ